MGAGTRGGESHYKKETGEGAVFIEFTRCKYVHSFGRINFFTLAQMLPPNAFRIPMSFRVPGCVRKVRSYPFKHYKPPHKHDVVYLQL